MKAGKPEGPIGQTCPIKDAPTDGLNGCMKCMFWRPMEVLRGGKSAVEWDCAMVWPLLLDGIANARLDAMTVSTQEMRNEFGAFKTELGNVVVTMAQLAASRRLAAPAPMKLIEHRDGEEQLSNQS